MTSVFERYLTVWVGLCIIIGIFMGKIAPGIAKALDGSVQVDFVELPLDEAVEVFRQSHQLPLVIDRRKCISCLFIKLQGGF